jgi:8-oxo-dGTP diphosphatase
MQPADMRSEILRSILSIKPLDAAEQAHIDFVQRWIKSGAEIFRTAKPATPETHLVAYFLPVSQDLSQVLLVDHKKAELWLPPGGHVEPGEHPRRTVVREAQEELGVAAELLDERPLFLTVTKTVGGVARHTDVSLWYLLKGDPKESLSYDTGEFNQIRWFGINEIPFAQSDPHMRRFVEKLGRLHDVTWQAYESTAAEYACKVASLHPHLEAERLMCMIPPAGKILDIGCGSGRDAQIFSERGYRVTGIDYSPSMIALAKSQAPRASFEVADMLTMQIAEIFDAVWANASLLHLAKNRLQQVLKKIYRLLNAQGVFYVMLKQGFTERVEVDTRYGAIGLISTKGSAERGKARPKRSGLNEEGMAGAMSDEEDRPGKAAAGRIMDEIKPIAPYGNAEKYYAYFELDELKAELHTAGFEIVDLYTTGRKAGYDTHPTLHAFCKKPDKSTL